MSVNPWRSEKVRRTRAEVQPIADALASEIRELNPGLEFHFGGSWRRGAESIGDLDLLLVTEDGTMQGVVLPPFVVVQRSGSRMTQGDYSAANTTMHVDFWSCSPPERGAFLWFITGPKELNIAMRGAAGSRGLLLNQKGLFNVAGGTPVQVDDGTEGGVAVWLGSKWMAYLEPTSRQAWAAPKGPMTSSVVVPSSSGGGKTYTVDRSGDNYQCSCPGFSYRGKCRHVDEVRAGCSCGHLKDGRHEDFCTIRSPR
jgi:DNA polymerase/3'-5' exonuclease PolX